MNAEHECAYDLLHCTAHAHCKSRRIRIILFSVYCDHLGLYSNQLYRKINNFLWFKFQKKVEKGLLLFYLDFRKIES